MSNKPTNLDDIIELGKIAEGFLKGKDYFVGTVTDRLRVVAEQNPYDQALRTMHSVFEKRFSKEGALAIVSQHEIQELYDEVGGLGSAELFRSELGDLLLNNHNPNVAHHNDDYIATLRGRGRGDDLQEVDQEIIQEFESLFSEPTDKIYHGAAINSGKRGVQLELISMGFENPAVEIAARNDDFVVYAAEVDTRFGRTPLLVPAEVKLGSVLLPSVFVSGNEFVDFTQQNVLAHAELTRSIKQSATPNGVLTTLAKLKGSTQVVKTASNDQNHLDEQIETTYFFEAPGLYSELVDEGPAHGEGLDFLQIDVPEPLRGLTEDFISETLVESGLSFDREAVLKAKNVLANELRGMGFNPDKIKIASEFPEGIVLSTAIVGKGGKKTIEVPIEIKNGGVLMPNTFTSGVNVKAFNEKNIKSLADTKEEGEFNAIFSDKHHMNFDELYNRSLKNAAYGNFLEVEECLAVIENKFGESFHKTAFDDLMELVRIGFNSVEEKPLDAIDEYIKTAAENIRHKEANMKMSSTLLFLYPEE